VLDGKGFGLGDRVDAEGASLATPQPLLDAPGYLVRRLYQAYVATWVRQVDNELTGAQFAVLVAVAEHTGCDQGSLASAVALDRSTMADIARRMEQKGLITRTPDTADGRRKLLALTPLGEETLVATNGRARALDQRLMAGLSPDQRVEVMRVLEGLSQAWADVAGET
jgi:MarR family transcriptional regulator, temperature-dependent positive regulator of motility